MSAMSETAPQYHHGDQDISEQVVTFELFGGLVKWASLAIAVLVLVLTLWFCVGAGFFGGLIPGVVVLAAGIFFLRSKPAEEH
jgi:hypothetical protein